MTILLYGALLTASVALATEGVRRRRIPEDSKDDAPSSTSVQESRVASDYSLPLLIPGLVALLMFVAYYGVTPEKLREVLSLENCRRPTPEERVQQWQVHHKTTALSNVSDHNLVQTLFDQALLWRWGYSLEGAHVTFSAAVEVDPTCAMCYWGLAYAEAPFANIVALPEGTRFPHFSDQMNKNGREYLTKAAALPSRSDKATAYIDAMWIRFPEVQHVEIAHQKWHEFLYAARMLKHYKSDLGDLVAGALAAEAFANVIPWDYYDNMANATVFDADVTWSQLIDASFTTASKSNFNEITGYALDDVVLEGLSLQPETEKNKNGDSRMRLLARVIEHLLLKIIESEPSHPLATHLHIHITEASNGDYPTSGLSSASNLANVSRQWMVGHLMHMPSHIFLRVGEYAKCVEVNERAHEQDIKTDATCSDSYVPEHNLKVLVACASLGGYLDKAEEYSVILTKMPRKISYRRHMSGGWDYVTLLEVWGQFGQWSKILSTEAPSSGARGISESSGSEFAQAMYHYYRYMATTHSYGSPSRRLLQSVDAATEFAAMMEAATKVAEGGKTIPGAGIGIYASGHYDKTQIAVLYAKARNSTLHKDTKTAINHIHSVIDIVKKMGYMEPPWAQQPPKQCLGYLLLRDNQLEDAKETYAQDLVENPRNPWSILGLAQVYAAMQRQSDANLMMKQFHSSGSAPITSSCPMLEITLTS